MPAKPGACCLLFVAAGELGLPVRPAAARVVTAGLDAEERASAHWEFVHVLPVEEEILAFAARTKPKADDGDEADDDEADDDADDDTDEMDDLCLSAC